MASREDISLNPENVENKEEYKTELAKTSLEEIDKEYKSSMNELVQEIKSSKDLDLMGNLEELKIEENLLRTYTVLKETGKNEKQAEKAYALLLQIRSLKTFEILKVTKDKYLEKSLVAAIEKKKIKVMKQGIKKMLPPMRRRLEQNKKYTYMDPNDLLMYLKAALPEGRKHYAYPFILCLFCLALNYNLSRCSTFLTQTFINIKNLTYQPDKHPEILTNIINFCEKEFHCEPRETAMKPDSLEPPKIESISSLEVKEIETPDIESI